MSDLEGIGMVVVALGSVLGLVAAVSGPLVKLNSAITRLETVLTALQDRMAEAGGTIKDLDARMDRAETTVTEHGMRIERLEDECAKHRQRRNHFPIPTFYNRTSSRNTMYGRYDTIYRGTTPGIELEVPYDTRLISKLYATWTQEGETVLEMDVADVMIGEGKVWLPMQQADTLALGPGFATMQVRALFSDGSAIASEPQVYRVADALKGGVIS